MGSGTADPPGPCPQGMEARGGQTEPGVGLLAVGQSQGLPGSGVFFFFPFYLPFNLSASVAHMFAWR